MTVAIPYARSGLWVAEVEHLAANSSDARVDAGTGTRYNDILVRSPSRILKATGQPVAGTGGTGEFHYLRKATYPFGTWHAVSPTIAEAVSLAELAWTLSAEGVCAAAGISVGSILRVTGVVAADTPDRVIKRVVRVTGVALLPGQPDEISVEDIWSSVDRAFDTAATLELYDQLVVNGSIVTEDVWRDVTPTTKVAEALTAVETDLSLVAEGDAATAGIVPGSVIRHTATETGLATATEIMLVTSITLAGGVPDVLNVIRGYWGTAAKAFDADASKLETLEGQITDLKALNSVADNTRYNPVTLDDNFLGFDVHDVIRSIVAGAAEVRVGILMGPGT